MKTGRNFWDAVVDVAGIFTDPGCILATIIICFMMFMAVMVVFGG